MGEVLNVEEACQFLKISKPGLYKLVRAGKIPSFKLGKCLRFDKEGLHAWIRVQVEASTAKHAKEQQ